MSNSNPTPIENNKLIKGVMDFVSMVNVAIAVSVWNGVNQASQDIIRVQEQTTSIRAEISLIRSDTAKNIEIQNNDIKIIQQRLARLEATAPTKP